MRVEGSIAGSTGQLLVKTKWDVLKGAGIRVFLGQTKVDQEDGVSRGLGATQEEVVRLRGIQWQEKEGKGSRLSQFKLQRGGEQLEK